MIDFLLSSVVSFCGVPALLTFVGLWYVLGCFRLFWWLGGGV